jgi:phosphoribosylamine--glycine ligase
MKVLLIGNGAREHIIAESLAGSCYSPELYAVMTARNPGIVKLAKDVVIGDITNPAFVTDFAVKNSIDFAVVGPEAPLEKGVVDAMEKEGIPSVGPNQSAARIETDKSFNRWLMEKYKTAGRVMHRVFSDAGEAGDFIDSFGKPVVIKPLGLTGGKGVKIVDPLVEGQLKNLEEAKQYAEKVIEDGMGGHHKVIIEEKAEGEEFTLQAFVDGENVVGTPLVQDHKFAFEGDTGPFTGGMGSYSDANHLLPFVRREEYEEALNIIRQVALALKKEGIKYKGILYGGFMLTKDGPKILEFNARFGDPEAMNTLPILETDFVDVCQAIIDSRLDSIRIKFKPAATVCKYAAPEGYPVSPVKDERIEIGPVPSDACLYFASVDQKPDGLYMTGSRAVAFVGMSETVESAEGIAQSAVSGVRGPVFYRSDIGTAELIKRRIEHMEKVRER